MLFAHDTEVALTAAAALVNTDSASDEALPDVAALDAFVAAWGWTGLARAATTSRARAGAGAAAAAARAVGAATRTPRRAR